MPLEPGVTIVPSSDIDGIAQLAIHAGDLVYWISTGERSDREAFFDAVKSVLPLDPPITGSYSWDALSDSLWEGMRSQNANRIVILWPDAASFARYSPDEFEVAISVFDDVARFLLDVEITMGNRVEVYIYIGKSY